MRLCRDKQLLNNHGTTMEQLFNNYLTTMEQPWNNSLTANKKSACWMFFPTGAFVIVWP